MSILPSRSAFLLVLVALSVGLVFMAGSDGAETTPYVEENANDLPLHAAGKGISLEEAERLYGWHQDMSSALDSISEAYPDDYTFAKFHDGSATVGFSGNTPDIAQQKLDSFSTEHGVSVTVVDNLGYNDRDIGDSVKRVHKAIVAIDGVKDAITGQTDGVIWSEVLVDGVATPAKLDSLRSKAETALGESSLTLDVRFSTYEGDSLFDDQTSSAHLGGESISTCTTAFTVHKQSNPAIKGVLTAAHCSNNQTDDGRTLAFQEEHESDYGDFQWHIGPQSEPDDFYRGGNSTTEYGRRDVQSTGTPEVGETVCRNGRTTHRECSLEIIALDICGGGGSVCELALTEQPSSQDGDSGGPVYDNNDAIGIWRGIAQYQGNPVGVFSRADMLHLALPVYINWSD